MYVEQVISNSQEVLQRAYNTARKLKVKLIASLCRKQAQLTRAAVFSQWHEQETPPTLLA
jgi:hypothetical protein